MKNEEKKDAVSIRLDTNVRFSDVDPDKYYIGHTKDGGFVKRGKYIYNIHEIIDIKEIIRLQFIEIMARIAEGKI